MLSISRTPVPPNGGRADRLSDPPSLIFARRPRSIVMLTSVGRLWVADDYFVSQQLHVKLGSPHIGNARPQLRRRPRCHFPKSTAMNCQSGLQRGAYLVGLGHGSQISPADPQRFAVDFGKLQVFAVHFDQDCRGLWQGKPLYFNGDRCSRLWKMTPCSRTSSASVHNAEPYSLISRVMRSRKRAGGWHADGRGDLTAAADRRARRRGRSPYRPQLTNGTFP
jgi:hypothetical protein